MIYRRKIYTMLPERIEAMNEFFYRYVLPLQEKHGAKLIGRWINEERTEILAVWAYASREAYEDIELQIAQDPEAVLMEQKRESYGPLFLQCREDFLYSL